MKLKHIFSLLLIFILLFNLTACRLELSITDSETSVACSPILYKVTDDNGDVVWLLGSIHVGRDDYYPLPDYILDALDNSDSLAVECDIIAFENNSNHQYRVLSKLLYKDGTTIKDHIPRKLYYNCVNILQDLNLYSSAFDSYMPILWAEFIESSLYEKFGVNTDLGIDRHLMNRASENGIEILEIESVDFQYQMMADFSDELQILMLESAIETYNSPDGLEDDLDYLMDLWASGDEKKFTEYLANDISDLTDEELQLYNEYNNAMTVNRNINMTNYAENALLSGDEIFICVGAAHVIGDGGMAQLLEERGYTVEIVN